MSDEPKVRGCRTQTTHGDGLPATTLEEERGEGNAGHVPHMEQPKAFLRTLSDIDSSLRTREGEGGVRRGAGSNFDRLAEIKAKYDPNNLFRTNRNIRPRVDRAEKG